MIFDDIVKTFDGVKFFLSCITGTTTNRADAKDIRYGISYFIVFKQTEKTSVDSLFAAFHDNNMDTTISKIKSGDTKDELKDIMLSQLCTVVKVSVFIYSVWRNKLYPKYGIQTILIVSNIKKIVFKVQCVSKYFRRFLHFITTMYRYTVVFRSIIFCLNN